MQNAMVKSDFRVTATHFVNIFVFLLIFEISDASSIVRVKYSAPEVLRMHKKMKNCEITEIN